MSFDLTGRVALVTGGNGGIGLGMAKGLADAGARVAIAGRNADKNAAAVEMLGEGAMAVIADVTDAASRQRMVTEVEERFGGLDIFIANAGINRRKLPTDYTQDDWRAVIDTNLDSVFGGCQAVYPAMKRRGGGKIVTIGSMLSIFGLPLSVAYGASKGGVMQMTKGLASAWAADNIQVNCVLPGWIDTELTRKARIDMTGLDDNVKARTPAGRWGEPADLAGIAVFLASPAADFVTGTAIPVDGGYSIMG